MQTQDKKLGIISEEELFALLNKHKGNLKDYSYTVSSPFCLHRKYFSLKEKNDRYPVLHFGQGTFSKYFILSDLDCGGLDISECQFKVTPAILGSVKLHGGKFYDGGALKSLNDQGKLEEWKRLIPDANFPTY